MGIGGTSSLRPVTAIVCWLVLLGLFPTAAAVEATDEGSTIRASVRSDGSQFEGSSNEPSLSSDGWHVAFSTFEPELFGGKTQIYSRNLALGVLELVSVSSDGVKADGHSSGAALSADGRYVAFESTAFNLVPGLGFSPHVYVRDRASGITELVSRPPDGHPNGTSRAPDISADGRYVAFVSNASNLVPGDTNDRRDVFVRDRVASHVERVSVASGGAQASGNSWEPAISADGRYVAFTSEAFNLVPGDTNGERDVFVHDRYTHETTRVSLSPEGLQMDGESSYPALSATGRYVAFQSYTAGWPSGHMYVYAFDRETGRSERVDVASDGTEGSGGWHPSISGDGRFVAFKSNDSTLVGGDTNNWIDVFLRDRLLRATTRVSVPDDPARLGHEANHASLDPEVGGDGRHVAFTSFADNLVDADTNDRTDVFVRIRSDVGRAPEWYVALGDSYSSGVGAGSYFWPTAREDVNECHRSRRAYSQLILTVEPRFRALQGSGDSGADVAS